MRNIEFTFEEREMFCTIYLAFISSRKAPESMAELSTATGVLAKLKEISEEPPGAPENSVVRNLVADGGGLMLEEVEYKYLTDSIYPPGAKWTHQGIETLASIQAKFDAVEKE